MSGLIIDGALLGLLVSFSFGPAFFGILQTGITKGFKFGVFMSIGIIISDVLLITLSYIIGASIFDDENNKIYAGIIGGIVLIIFGIVIWLKKPEILRRRHIKYKTPKITDDKLYHQVVRGFFLNIANPFLLFFWFGALGIVSKSAPSGMLLESAVIFFSATLITVFSFDLLKSYLSGKIKNLLTPRVEIYINKLIGLVLTIFGFVLILNTLRDTGIIPF
jgi:threonine/homoserine/homoserine lactone efflux protein